MFLSFPVSAIPNINQSDKQTKKRQRYKKNQKDQRPNIEFDITLGSFVSCPQAIIQESMHCNAQLILMIKKIDNCETPDLICESTSSMLFCGDAG